MTSSQIGWESLEAARCIFNKMPSTLETEGKLAKIHREFGALHVQLQQYPQAEQEFGERAVFSMTWRVAQ